ncbi:13751_t:CDS:1, partial [Gigaspora rosea]
AQRLPTPNEPITKNKKLLKNTQIENKIQRRRQKCTIGERNEQR